jgi:hypothetical protein
LFPRTRKDRKFCKEECRKEFHRFGSGYGPIKQALEKLIEKRTRDQVKEVSKRLTDIEQLWNLDRQRGIVDYLARLEVRIVALESANTKREAVAVPLTSSHLFETGGQKCLHCGCGRIGASRATCV